MYDQADVFSLATEELAARRIADIERLQQAKIVVFTQHKPGADAASTGRDARALMVQWGVGVGLVIMWNRTSTDCGAGAQGNAHVQLYAGARYTARHLSDSERQAVAAEMVPLLGDCKADDALLAALASIHGVAAAAPSPSTSKPGSASGACADRAYELSGFRWKEPLVWHFQETSVPDEYESNEVLEVLRRSASNITDGKNDCGFPDNIDAVARFAGPTLAEPCVEDSSDGVNSIGFAELPEDAAPDTLALTCPYGTRNSVVEVDILINSDIAWALTKQECRGDQEVLEATLTHEFGHVFGLSHVSERLHGDLTMSPTSNGACDAEEISLGLGDVLGLEQLY